VKIQNTKNSQQMLLVSISLIAIIIIITVVLIITQPNHPQQLNQLLLLPPETATSEPWFTSIGQSTNEFNNLLTIIKSDIQKIRPGDFEIKVFIGPYFKHIGTVGQLYKNSSGSEYSILLDTEFYNTLLPEEKKVFVAHEAGHILFNNPRDNSLKALTDAQILADNFATKYVHPRHVKSWLDKIYYDYLERSNRLELLLTSQ